MKGEMGVYAYLVRDEEWSGFAKRVVVALALLVVMGVGMAMMASPAQAADLAVTSNADDGPGTLRAAVDTANGNGVADNIFFNLPSNQRTITLGSPITFTDTAKTTIDGGTAGVTVSGGNTTRVFFVSYGANLSLKNLKVSGGNAIDDSGGGIFNAGGTLSITDSTISGNSAEHGGGGIYNQGTVSVTDSTISGNSANLFDGGGIYNQGTLNVTDSTISGNFATGHGGGIVSGTNQPGQKTTVVNSTISGNTAQEFGGGVYNGTGLTTISNSTITNNTAPSGSGAGVASYGDPDTRTVVDSSIIAANSSTDVNYVYVTTNSFVSAGYNLIGDGNATAAFNKTGDQIISNNSPGLGALANNGGPTRTHALLAGSPALNTIPQGTNGCAITLTQDQRGLSRPQGRACDTGSFELANAAPKITVVAGSASQSACLATNRGRVTLKLSDANGDPLTLSATSSNTTLLPTSNITFSDTGATRTATITTVSGRTGTSNLKIKVSDGEKSSTVAVTVKSGSNANNTISGTSGADLLLGQGGADTLDGLGSSDVLCGAAGNDRLRGGVGADTLNGGSGTDTTPDYSAAGGDSRTNIP